MALAIPPSRSTDARRREFKELLRLTQLFGRRCQHWQVGNAGFEARVPLRLGGTSGRVVYKLHAVGWGERRMRFLASVTIWPSLSGRWSGRKKADKAFRD